MKVRMRCISIEQREDPYWLVKLGPEKPSDPQDQRVSMMVKDAMWWKPGASYVVEFSEAK